MHCFFGSCMHNACKERTRGAALGGGTRAPLWTRRVSMRTGVGAAARARRTGELLLGALGQLEHLRLERRLLLPDHLDLQLQPLVGQPELLEPEPLPLPSSS